MGVDVFIDSSLGEAMLLKNQLSFADVAEPSWKDEWRGMPEFIQEQQRPFAKLIIRFEAEEDLQEFAALIGQKLTDNYRLDKKNIDGLLYIRYDLEKQQDILP